MLFLRPRLGRCAIACRKEEKEKRERETHISLNDDLAKKKKKCMAAVVYERKWYFNDVSTLGTIINFICNYSATSSFWQAC